MTAQGSRLRALWQNLLHRDRMERDLDDEVRSTFELLAAEKVRAGMRPEDARRAAMLEIGGVEAVKEQVRDVKAGALVETLLQDVRYAARLLRRNPLFTLTAALSLTIGIGANTTVFTVANALLFRDPPGVADPGRLVDIGRSQDGAGFDNGSYPNYLDVRDRATTLDGVYAYRLGAEPMSLGNADGAERIFGDVVTANYFTVLGARSAAGRLFGPGDSDEPGKSPIVVLSHGFWTRRFNQDPAIVGRTLQLNGQPFVVVGVASEGFHGTSVLGGDVWIPIGMVSAVMPSRSADILTSRPSVWLVMGGRLKPGVSASQAAAELDLIGRTLEREYPDENRGKGLRLLASAPIPGNSGVVAGFLALLTAIVSLVLVIACANVAGVLLARATARRREIAVRLAIGAGRGRLVRQLLTETTMLFVLGGAGGLLMARGLTSFILSQLPALPVPVDVSLTLDGRVIAFTVGLSLVAALLSGLVPALQSSRAEVVSALKDDAQVPHGRSRLRHVFVVGQVALSIVLVVAAGLFVRALQRAGSIDPGFDPRGVEVASFDFSLAGYTNATGPIFARELVDRVRGLPGVRSASLTRVLPLAGSGLGLGPLTAPGGQPFSADWNIVEAEYFETMRIQLVSGRDFSAGDRDGTQPVAIVGELAAGRFWPGQDAVGKYLQQPPGPPGTDTPARTLLVVGVARDLKYRSLGDIPRLFVYVPFQQRYDPFMSIVARTANGQRITSEIRALVASMNPNLPITAAQTLEDVAALGLAPQRIAASVSGSLGSVGLLLAAIGIYGVTAYAVTRRTREIGVRLALGASRADIVRMVLRQGMSLAAVGSVIGLLLAAGASRLLVALLFGVPPLDPVTFLGAAVLLAAVGLAACYLPARRATRIDPIEALRYE
ncbi:MAG: ABC transporter permease [Vicinamibacterales bacterium]